MSSLVEWYSLKCVPRLLRNRVWQTKAAVRRCAALSACPAHWWVCGTFDTSGAKISRSRMIPFPFLQVFAATDATTLGLNGSNAESEFSDFPGEHPSDKDLSDWLDAVLPKLRRAYGALLRGETPQNLLQYEGGADDLTGLVRIDPNAAPPSGMNEARVMQHNRHVDVEHAAKASRRRQLENGLRTEKNNLAQTVITMLRRRAPLRLKALLARHAVVGHADCHDGAQMMNDLIALRGTVGQHEEGLDHDREVERLRDESLPDGCSVDDYMLPRQ